MSFSLNEVEALAKKAARGAGYSWGLAEEAGKAVRWLCSHDIDGCGALAGLLAAVDGKETCRYRWQELSGVSEAEERLCPLTFGAGLSDRARFLRSDEPIEIGNLIEPVLVLPFAALASRATSEGVTVVCEGASAWINSDDAVVQGNWPSEGMLKVVIRPRFAGPKCARRDRATPDPKHWNILSDFAARTYAPETAESRLKGAGAGLNDND